MSSHVRQLEQNQAERFVVRESFEVFDRVGFALRVLKLLAPPQMRVAVYECRRGVRAERGRDLPRGTSATWGILGIPRSASRHAIVLAVAELTGTSELPFVLDLLSTARPESLLN